MLPKMRYQPIKLDELYHQRKTFYNHRTQLQKIKTKPINTHRQSISFSNNRSQHIQQLRNRIQFSYNYQQQVRGDKIKKQNLTLFKKISSQKFNKRLTISHDAKNSTNQSFKSWLNEQLPKSDKKPSLTHVGQNKSPVQREILRNHRQSPINKTTKVDRAKQNLRLALKIHKPIPTINTKKLEKIHDEARRLKNRIMRYDSSTPKTQRYLDKRLSSRSFFSSTHRKSCDMQPNFYKIDANDEKYKTQTFSLTQQV